MLCLCSQTLCSVTVRLVGSSLSHQGRLEVYYNGSWGTVCDDSFSNVDARVACFSLGYGLDRFSTYIKSCVLFLIFVYYAELLLAFQRTILSYHIAYLCTIYYLRVRIAAYH